MQSLTPALLLLCLTAASAIDVQHFTPRLAQSARAPRSQVIRLRGGISESEVESVPGMAPALDNVRDMMKVFSEKFDLVKGTQVMSDIMASKALKDLYEDLTTGKPLDLVKYFTDEDLLKVFRTLVDMLGMPEDIGAAGEQLASVMKAAGLVGLSDQVKQASGLFGAASKFANQFGIKLPGQ
mmetsp:Transcript_9204/g.23006  ORF Transcript_9204/g.23006 Transcript_9204/m.23006 type:complete len:182 (-) Transcript_9204:308-853(-)